MNAFSEAVKATNVALSGSEQSSEVALLLLDLIDRIGNKLLVERPRQVDRKGTPFDQQHEIDRMIHEMVETELANRGELISEESDKESAKPVNRDMPNGRILDPVVNRTRWILDPVDNTNEYKKADGGSDWGTALMVIDGTGNVIASAFALPAKEKIYFATETMAWSNGQQLKRLVASRPPHSVVLRIGRRAEPLEILSNYAEIWINLNKDKCEILPGRALTALDQLALAEGSIKPHVFIYRGKPHDVLIAASIARAVGATTTVFDDELHSWQSVFPVTSKLLHIARTKDARALFDIRRPGVNITI